MLDDVKLRKYKTVLCQRMSRSGSCRYGLLCDFAHQDSEMRRNLNQHWYYGVKCEKPRCIDKLCSYAHNDMEVMYHPHIYKTKLCTNFTKATGCPKKNYCSFAHGKHELRSPKFTNAGSHLTNTTISAIDSTQLQSTAIPVPQNGVPPTAEGLQGIQNQFPSLFTQPTTNHPVAGGYPLDHTKPQPTQINPHSVVPGGPIAIQQAAHMVPPMDGLTREALGFQYNVQDGKDFQEATNSLKIKILDLVDSISAMHYERAAIEQEKAKNMYSSESSRLQSHLEQQYHMIQKQQQEQINMTSSMQETSKRLEDAQKELEMKDVFIEDCKKTTTGVASRLEKAEWFQGRGIFRLSLTALEQLLYELKSVETTVRKQKNQLKQREGDLDVCNICAKNRIEVVFDDCHHQIACLDCGRKSIGQMCPVCATQITQVVTIVHDIGRPPPHPPELEADPGPPQPVGVPSVLAASHVSPPSVSPPVSQNPRNVANGTREPHPQGPVENSHVNSPEIQTVDVAD